MRAVITTQQVREFIRDLPGENTLVQGIRFTDNMIEGAMRMAVAYYNEMPPYVGTYTVENFPAEYALMYGTLGQLLKGAAIGEASNAMQYSVDGVSVNDRETRMQLFQSIGNQFWSEFVDHAKSLKMSKQLANAFGVSHSEFNSRRAL